MQKYCYLPYTESCKLCIVLNTICLPGQALCYTYLGNGPKREGEKGTQLISYALVIWRYPRLTLIRTSNYTLPEAPKNL